MKYLMILIAILFMSLYGGLSYYIGLRGWQNIGNFIPILNSKAYWILFWLVAISYIAGELLNKYLPEALATGLDIVGGYWLAIMMYLLIVLPVIDLIRVLNRRIQFLPNRLVQNEKSALFVAVIVLIALTGLMIYGTWSGRSTKVNRYSIDVNKKAGNVDKLNIVMVSDIHLGGIVDNARLSKMVDEINALQPDIILMAGDIIDSKLEPFTKHKMGENFKRLKSKYGVFACLGNHESFGAKAEDIVTAYEEASIKVLRDSSVLIDDSFYVAGRDDSSFYRGSSKARKDLKEILAGLDKTKPILLMDHQPRELDKVEKERVDLQVSGHTHRGQFFPNNLITKAIYEIDFGYLKKGDLNVVVSSGYGTWGPPIRIGSRSEIVEINVNFLK